MMFWNPLRSPIKSKRKTVASKGAGASDLVKEEFLFEGHKVVIERKPRRRSVSIYLRPDKPIRVVASLSTSLQKIESFLNDKKSWILKHQNKFAQEAVQHPQKKILQSEKFPFLGAELELRFLVTPLKKAFFSRTEKSLNLHLPLAKWNQLTDEELALFISDLKFYYKKEAQAFISERIQVWSETMNLHPKLLKFRNPKTRWGSCNSKGVISINWRLIAAPVDVIDYILVHEISHLKHMNHSQNFWNLVEEYFPEYRKAEKWLDQNHKALDFLI